MNAQLDSFSGDTIYTVPEVATFLKISKAKIYYLIARREIAHLKIGRNVRIRATDLQRWINLQVQQPDTGAVSKTY
jgi:excisionase family DNA binding protein